MGIICDRCRKDIDINKEFILIRSTNTNSGYSNHKLTNLSYHRECFDKLFIYRDESGHVDRRMYRRLCTCESFADYESRHTDFIDIKLIGAHTLVEMGQNHYYHRKHFLKYWNGDKIKKVEDL